MANGNQGAGAGLVVGISAPALILGALAIGGGALLFHHFKKRHTHHAHGGGDEHEWHDTYTHAAAHEISPDGCSDLMFDTMVDNADRPETVLQNEDRVREVIKSMMPHVKDLITQYINGRLSYPELMQEIRASTIEIHKNLDIPVKYGDIQDFHPDTILHPRNHGHRMHRKKQPKPGDPDDYNENIISPVKGMLNDDADDALLKQKSTPGKLLFGSYKAFKKPGFNRRRSRSFAVAMFDGDSYFGQ